MAERARDFVRDTERRLRRANKSYRTVEMLRLEQILPTMIERKRAQYRRTGAEDALASEAHARLLAGRQ